jgi:RNA polymerase I-specific transcription initiation factor RRN6
VMLACTRIRQRDSQAEAPAAQPSLSQDSAIAMPILSSQPLAAGSADPIWMSSQPSQKGFSSQTRTQSQSQPSASSSSMVDPLARLGKYLKLRDDGGPPPQTNFPPSVTQLLSHWQSGVDPSTYDWEAIERADRVENLDETTQQRIEKARKKKERRERRQQRENELAQSKPSSQPFAKPQLPSQPFVHLQPSSQLATFLKPATFPQSSPGPMLGSSIQRPYTQIPLPGTAFGSQSEEFPSTLAAQSQVEPGRFGGRPDKKKKKKKNRVSGF